MTPDETLSAVRDALEAYVDPYLGETLGSVQAVREVRAADGAGADVYADRGGSLIAEIAAVASSTGAELSDVHISEPSLENLFLHHTGRSLRD